MKTIFPSLSALFLVLLLGSCAATDTGGGPPVTGPAADYRNSKADVVVLNIFNMYCPHCQVNAKYVNELYELTQSRGAGSRIDFYAIGWGNTPMEADMYRTRYNVKYPVVPDRDRSISSPLGDFRPPLLLALRKQGGRWTEFYRTTEVRGKAEEIYSKIQP